MATSKGHGARKLWSKLSPKYRRSLERQGYNARLHGRSRRSGRPLEVVLAAVKPRRPSTADYADALNPGHVTPEMRAEARERLSPQGYRHLATHHREMRDRASRGDLAGARQEQEDMWLDAADEDFDLPIEWTWYGG